MAPKSLPHRISVPGLQALFGGPSMLREEPTPAAAPGRKEGEGSPFVAVVPTAPPARPPTEAAPAPTETAPVSPPRLEAVPPAPAREPEEEPKAKRRISKSVRVTQPETKGHPKGRHTLVIGDDVLEDLSLLAWAENMSVSALAREAFDAFLAKRKGALEHARKIRDSFDQPREAV